MPCFPLPSSYSTCIFFPFYVDTLHGFQLDHYSVFEFYDTENIKNSIKKKIIIKGALN